MNHFYVVCKKWSKIFNENLHWILRLKKDFPSLSSESAFQERLKIEPKLNWKKFYKDQKWKITILEAFNNRDGCNIMTSFSIFVSPQQTVKEFIEACKNAPNNNQRHRFNISSIYPFNTLHFKDERNLKFYMSNQDPVFNCSWDYKTIKPETKIIESGLTDGAYLEMDSGWMD